MNILSPVEKLIHYRKMYKISQEELVKDSIARSYLAMIESKRKKLNNKIAGILVTNFNSIMQEKEINFSLSLDYLLEDKEAQITKITESLLTKINSSNVESIALEAETLFLEEESIDNRVKIYLAIADTYFEKNLYDAANKYYYMILSDYIKSKDSAMIEKIILQILRGNNISKAYLENIILKQKISRQLDNFSIEAKKESLMHFAIAALKTKKCNNVVEIFKELEKSANNEKIFKLKMLQADCYISSEDYETAASIYRGALLKFKDNTKKLIVNFRLLKLAKLQNDDEKQPLYLRKVFNLIKEIHPGDIENYEKFLFEIGLFAKNLGKRKRALNSFEEIINLSNDNELKLQGINHSLDLLKKLELKQVKALEEIYFKLGGIKDFYKVGYKFIAYYSTNNLNKFEAEFKKNILIKL